MKVEDDYTSHAFCNGISMVAVVCGVGEMEMKSIFFVTETETGISRNL